VSESAMSVNAVKQASQNLEGVAYSLKKSLLNEVMNYKQFI